MKHYNIVCVGSTVTNEVWKIMGPYSARSTYNSSVSGISLSQIPRRPKRHSKAKIAADKHGSAKKKERASTIGFQKKLIVFRFMSESAQIAQPKTFTRSDRHICVHGLLPFISIETSEKKIREEICDVINSASTSNDVALDDFEFINMSGKQGSVPQCKKGFHWDGRAVKELAGSGSVYVRLTRYVRAVESDCEGSGAE